jgi:hypothetical protein
MPLNSVPSTRHSKVARGLRETCTEDDILLAYVTSDARWGHDVLS